MIINVQCFLPMTCGEFCCPRDIFRPNLAAIHTTPIKANWKMMVTTSGSIRVAAQTQKARSRAKEITIHNAGVRIACIGLSMRTGVPP